MQTNSQFNFEPSFDSFAATKKGLDDIILLGKFKHPRFEVISLYPYSEFKMGDIISPLSPEKIALYKQFPILFRLLSWWEHRIVEEMPNYVITYNRQMILKVVNKEIIKENGVCWLTVEDNAGSRDNMKIDYLLPSTEKDYNLKYNVPSGN